MQPPPSPPTSASPPWEGYYGSGWPPIAPPPRRRSRKVVLAVVAGSVLVLGVLGVVVAAAVHMGHEAGPAFAAELSVAGDLPSAAPTTQPPSDPSGLGDDPGLDTYAVRCHDGDMQACDDLYDLSEPMSRYEQYGMTCGGRVKPFDVSLCTDLG